MTKKQYSYCVAGFIFLILLVTCRKGHAEVFMQDTLPAPTIESFILMNNPPCAEWLKVYSKYSKLATSSVCGIPGKRYRPWICNDGTLGEGIDIEHLPATPCDRSLYDILRDELGGN